MSRVLRNVLIVIGGLLAALLLVFFVLYKIFVTPQVKFQLALKNAAEDFSESFEIFTDDDEEDLIEYVLKSGGKSTYNMTLTKSPLFEGAALSLDTVGNAASSVTKLNFGNNVSLDMYKTDSEILVNIPLYNGGLKIPLNTEPSDWDNSAFKGAYDAFPHFKQSPIMKYFKDNDINCYEFFKLNKKALALWVRNIQVTKEYKDSVNIGGKTKKADVYIFNITPNDADALSQIVLNYLERSGKTENGDIKALVSDFAHNNDILLKVRGSNIYGMEIVNSEGDDVTLEFSGKGNPFNTVSYYKNGDKASAIVRNRKKNSNKLIDTITQNDSEILRLERTKSLTSLKYNYGSSNIEITANDTDFDENSLVCSDLDVKIGDSFAVSGRYTLTRRSKAEKVDFEKSGEYIDISTMPLPDWEAVSNSLSTIVSHIPKI